MAGITATGFSKKTLDEIITEWQQSFRDAFGNGCNFRPPSKMATIIGIASDREANLWDLAEECWNARGRSTSSGVSLDNAGELTNETRLGALPSTILNQLFFGTVGTVIPTTFIAAVNGNPSAQFSPLTSVTLIAGTNAVHALAFSAVPDAGTWTLTMSDGQTTVPLAYGAGAAAIQAAIRALVSLQDWSGVTVTGTYGAGFVISYGGASGLQPQSLPTLNSSVTHTATPVVITASETTPGVAQGAAVMEATGNGPTPAEALSVTSIVTPVTGLTSTRNTVAASLGRFEESDAAYRIRSQQDLQNAASTTVEAIRIALKSVPGVNEAIVYQNNTLATDGNGVPAKSVHAYVSGGANQDIGNKLWQAVGGGISTYGSIPVSVTDSQGLVQTLSFDRPTSVPIYTIVTITKNANYPANGDTLVMNTLLTYGAGLKIGDDVLVRPGLMRAITDTVPGIQDIDIKIGTAPTPTLSANIVTTASQIATFIQANQTVASS